MVPCWNVCGRPDAATVGIEQCWARVKHLYRIEVDRFKALNRPFSNMGLVQNVLGSLSEDFVKQLASHSVPAVMAMQPIQPLANELTRGDARATHPQYVHYSPQRLVSQGHIQPTFDDGHSSLRSQSPVVGREGVEDALQEREFRSFMQGGNEDEANEEDRS